MSDLLIWGYESGAPPASASIAFVQQSSGSSGGSASVIATMGSPVLSGDFLSGAVCLPPSVTVASITDSQFNRWIRNANSYTSGGNAELWSARGVLGGALTVTIVLSAAASVDANVSEWSGVWYVDPLDQWTANYGTSNSAATQSVTPRTTGDLVIGVVSTQTSIGAPGESYNALSMSGTGNGAAYYINPGSYFTSWSMGASSVWATCAACYVAGPEGLNPRFQFPETLVEISTTNNFLAPLEGLGVWTNISSYVRDMTLGPLGRQHELDRVQATPSQITVNNRDGSFNPWNTGSFLYNLGLGLQPMNPINVTAAWHGVTYPIYYGYFQSATPAISDVLNIDVDLNAIDLLQMLSLKYLSGNNYAQLVEADGGTNLQAYYRLGDPAGNFQVLDSSGNGNTGSLVDAPTFSATGAFLYDSNTALDCTGGTTSSPNGGFQTIDNTTEPPTIHNPLNSSIPWTMEMWFKWTGTSIPAPSVPATATAASVAAIPNGVLAHFTGWDAGISSFETFEIQVGYWVPVFGGTGQVTFLNGIVITVGSGIAQLFLFPTNPTDGNWHHLVVENGFNAYLDGAAPTAADTNMGASAASPSAITIGTPPQGVLGIDASDDANYAQGFLGVLQDVALYTEDLSLQQAAAHYATGLWFQQVEVGASVGSSSAGRLNKVLEVAGLNPSTVLSVPYPFKTQLYAETNSLTTTSALNYIQTQTESEPGLIFQLPTGELAAYNRQYQYQNSTSTASQGVFGDSTSATYHYNGPTFRLVKDDLDLWNDIQVQSGRSGAIGNSVFFVLQSGSSGATLQEWGPTQSAIAAQSASAYGTRTLQGLTSLQQEYDSDALALAQNYLVWYVNPIERVQQMQIDSYGGGGNTIPQQLGRGLYDRITVQYQGQTAGPQFSQDSLIEQVQHTVTADNGPTWTTTWSLSPFEILMSPFYLDSSTLDGPDILTL